MIHQQLLSIVRYIVNQEMPLIMTQKISISVDRKHYINGISRQMTIL